jgi:hypothetical protein
MFLQIYWLCFRTIIVCFNHMMLQPDGQRRMEMLLENKKAVIYGAD